MRPLEPPALRPTGPMPPRSRPTLPRLASSEARARRGPSAPRGRPCRSTAPRARTRARALPRRAIRARLAATAGRRRRSRSCARRGVTVPRAPSATASSSARTGRTPTEQGSRRLRSATCAHPEGTVPPVARKNQIYPLGVFSGRVLSASIRDRRCPRLGRTTKGLYPPSLARTLHGRVPKRKVSTTVHQWWHTVSGNLGIRALCHDGGAQDLPGSRLALRTAARFHQTPSVSSCGMTRIQPWARGSRGESSKGPERFDVAI